MPPTARVRPGEAPTMGYQPALDGVRALSVVAVILYHAGFGWMHGGFFGVEVFFVVSGYLITTLLIDEHRATGRTDLRRFWARRWRRLLPALFTMLLAVGVWAVFWGSAEQQSQLRRDLPWSIFYVANWGQITGGVAYFAPSPPLLRHLWSLAVEEQWYLIWPVVFLLLVRRRRSSGKLGRTLALASVVVMAVTALGALGELTPERTNLLYLSTVTRSSGLLLGAALAFAWRPWSARGTAVDPVIRRHLGQLAGAALAVLLAAFVFGRVESRLTYLVVLPAVTIASAVLVAVVVHPWAGRAVRAFAARPLVAVGRRSYGLYLWSWPISRITGAIDGSVARFVVAMAITVPVNEACYRFVETPIRRGAVGRWRRVAPVQVRRRVGLSVGIGAVVLISSLGLYYRAQPATFDQAIDTSNGVIEFDPAAAGIGIDDIDDPGTTDPTAASGAVTSTSTARASSMTTRRVTTTTKKQVTKPTVRRPVIVVVGDSQAHSFAVNLPSGTSKVLRIYDGAVPGCGVLQSGKAYSRVIPFKRTLSACRGFADKWGAAVRKRKADVALVMIGAWDVFDIREPSGIVVFASKEFDTRFTTGVQRGINAVVKAGAKVALLEIACMRPVKAKGSAVAAVPERGDDGRVAHLNSLLRQVAARNAKTTVFIRGPKEWCNGSPQATDVGMRWDGVHVYKPGAKLILQTIARPLVAYAKAKRAT